MSAISIEPALAEAAQSAAAWPFEEARKLVSRLERTGKNEALFETGYGPSGLPHIGTFGEVARTSMVRYAFRVLTNDSVPTRLIAFSDDMDGLRKGLDYALQELWRDGKYTELYLRFFPISPF